MKIKTIYIKNFGGLKNFKLKLNSGLNIIYGDNESGKTTVMNFIKMMFYGASSKSADIRKNPRRKYAPWNGSAMSGMIEFEFMGTDYRLERDFGSSNLSDSIKLWNLSTGENEPVSCKYEAGERFIGMGISAFEKSVFIGEVSSVISGTDKEDEISKRLMNFATSCDETVSYELIRKRLKKSHEELCSRNGKNGELDKLMQALSDKTEQLSKAEDEEQQKLADEELYTSFREHLRLKKEYGKKISDQIKEQHIIRELHSLEIQNRKNMVKDELKKRLDELYSNISNANFTVTDEFLDNCSDMLARLNMLKDIYSEKKANFNSLSNEISELHLSDIIQENYLDLDSLSEKKQELKDKIKKSEQLLKELEDAAYELQEKLRETQLKEELYKEHLADMESNTNSLIPITAIAISVISLLFRNPWILIAIVPAAAAIALMSKITEKIKTKKGSKPAPDYEQIYRDFDEVKAEQDGRRDELLQDLTLLGSEYSETEIRKNELEAENSKLIMKNEHNSSEINKLNASLSSTGNEITKLNADLISIFSSYKQVSNTAEIESYIDDAQSTLSEIEKTKAVLESKHEEDLIDDTPENIRDRMSELKKKLSDITGGHGPKLLSDEQLEKLEERLEENNNEINSLKDNISAIRSKIMSGFRSEKSPSNLRNDIDNIRTEIKRMSDFDRSVTAASEILEEAGNEIRQTFAPELNTKTQKIFSHLTGGKYSETIVSKNLEINASNKVNGSLHEWQYMSTGTSEQAYFSLRLALADMISKNQIPLFLDDVFAHYDDVRSEKGFRFLEEYGRLNQILFFTCHRYEKYSDRYIFPFQC